MKLPVPLSAFCMASCMAVTGSAQSLVVDTISARQPWSPFELYTFPHLGMAGHRDVAERINRDLAIDLLEVDPDTLEGILFQNVWGDPAQGPMPRLSSVTWSYARPLAHVLCFAFSAEACGAYCEGSTVHRTYDLHNGQRLEFDSLFTAVGLLW